MIAIDVTSTIKAGSANTSVWDDVPIIQNSYNDFCNFFQNCINQNLILNAAIINADPPESAVTSPARYFATTLENAQAFQAAFLDRSTPFSMIKCWEDHGWDISIALTEVDFDTATVGAVEIIGTFGELWGIEY
jgi:hypothetical protein